MNCNRFLRKRTKEAKGWVTNKVLALQNNVDPVRLQRIAVLVEVTGAAIVISSSWRLLCDPSEFEQAFAGLGYPLKVLGRTPRPEVLPSQSVQVGEHTIQIGPYRGDEIEAWLKHEAPEPVESFVILDDQNDMGPHMGRLVRIDDGIEVEHVEKAIALLQGS